MMLMVIGACGGSTGGGIKVSRFMILCKSIRQEIHKMLHPNAVTMVRMNGKKVGADTMRSINIYFSAYVFIIIVSVLLVSLDNFDFATSFSGVLTTINNVGPEFQNLPIISMRFLRCRRLCLVLICYSEDWKYSLIF